MTELESVIIGIMGKRQSGKTWQGDLCMKATNRPKILVFDTLDHPKYRHIKMLDIKDLPRFKKGMARVLIYDAIEIIDVMRFHVENTLVIFEDAGKYFTGNMPRDFNHMIYDSKQKKNDLIFMYHCFKDALPIVLKNLNAITILKLGSEDISIYRNKIPDYEDVLAVHREVQASKEQYPAKTILVNG